MEHQSDPKNGCQPEVNPSRPPRRTRQNPGRINWDSRTRVHLQPLLEKACEKGAMMTNSCSVCCGASAGGTKSATNERTNKPTRHRNRASRLMEHHVEAEGLQPGGTPTVCARGSLPPREVWPHVTPCVPAGHANGPRK